MLIGSTRHMVWALAALAAGGCGRAVIEVADGPDSGGGAPRCIPGKVEACACPAPGSPGVQTCKADGTFGACQCASRACVTGELVVCQCPDGRPGLKTCESSACGSCAAPPLDAGSRVDAGPPRDAGPPPDTSVVLNAGEDRLIELFPVPAGLLVVRSTAVQLLDQEGTAVTTLNSPREITAAAFDGTLLAVADKAKLLVYNTELTLQREATLLEPCQSAVILSRQRFVCGPPNDWDRIFAVYDLNTTTLLRRGPENFTYNGLPMRRVPGRDDFITVTTSSSPSDVHLYRLDDRPDAGVVFMGESPYHGAFAVTDVYAFDKSPAEHVITLEGLFLKIYTDACKEGSSSWTQGCFEKNGNLGTLPGNQIFLGMADTGDGTLYGIVPSGERRSYSSTLCSEGCDVQRIDIAARVIRATARWTAADVNTVLITRHDPHRQRVVVGYSKGTDRWKPTGWGIVSFNP